MNSFGLRVKISLGIAREIFYFERRPEVLEKSDKKLLFKDS
ncbi:hypothetical protein [Maribellus comscasis]|nr:hypothetical protein [Maribellus comscasis]